MAALKIIKVATSLLASLAGGYVKVFLHSKMNFCRPYLALIPRIGSTVIDDNFMYSSKFSEIFGLFKDFLIRQSWRKADHKDQVSLNNSNVGQMFPVLGDLLLLSLEQNTNTVKPSEYRTSEYLTPIVF